MERLTYTDKEMGEKLKKYEDAEEQYGFLLRLQLKVSDTVTIVHESDGHTEKYMIRGDLSRKAIHIYEEKTLVEMG